MINAKTYYKFCIVPQCHSSTVTTPDKLFIYVPNNEAIRKKWLALAKQDPSCYSVETRMHFCEDHFDLPNDMNNYRKLFTTRTLQRKRMRPGVTPSKFECQNRDKNKNDSPHRPNILRKRKPCENKTNVKEEPQEFYFMFDHDYVCSV